MTRPFTLSAVVPATPDEIYRAWLSSHGHSAMTGSPAKASVRIGGRFTAWDGYISGKNLELEPGKRIVQAWRTTEFGTGDEDSVVEVTFKPSANGTRVTIRHSRLPVHGAQYRQGWIDFYLKPMKAYFAR